MRPHAPALPPCAYAPTRRHYGDAHSLPLALAVGFLLFILLALASLATSHAASAPGVYYLRHINPDNGQAYAVATGLTHKQCQRALRLMHKQNLSCHYDRQAALAYAHTPNH